MKWGEVGWPPHDRGNQGPFTQTKSIGDQLEADEKSMNITLGFSKWEKMRQQLFRRWNRLSTSARRLYISQSYSLGSTQVFCGDNN